MERIRNEVVAVDVGELEREKFLVILDHAAQYYQGSWIQNKTTWR